MPPTVEGLHKAKRSEDSHKGQNSKDMLGKFLADFNKCIDTKGILLFIFVCFVVSSFIVVLFERIEEKESRAQE